ncbi:MAG TPA: FAD/NAD(P)-binding oxidoreductase, partial [Marmoricola sp.]|nr:FAD/NAD(P)-binding oxidoreductase [Marmoricola sp.]
MHISEMPIKCPVAPLEFTFLAEAWLREQGLRDRVEMTYVTPLDGAFTKPVASAHLGGMLEERKVEVVTDFMIESVDPERKVLV